MSEVTKGRKVKVDPVKVVAWRQARKASTKETAARFKISPATVKRYCRDHGEAAKEARSQWRAERESEEEAALDRAIAGLDFRRSRLEYFKEVHQNDPSWHNFFALVGAAYAMVPKEYRSKKPGDWSPPQI